MKYRKATMKDAKNLLRWKNQADTRKFAIVTHKKIKMKDHLKWLEKNLHTIYIIGNNYGDVRVTDEIAIKIDSKFQGKGYASNAVLWACEMFGDLPAKIVEGNIASMRTFIKCGFKPVAYYKGVYIFQR